MSYRIGIDIGGTFIKAGVVAEDYAIIGTASRPTGANRPYTQIVEEIARAALDAVAAAGVTMDEIVCVGAGCPGTCNQDSGEVEFSGNLGFHHVPLCAMLRERLQKPVYIQNDANAAVLGEALAGAARGRKNCVAVTLGTGVGGGVLIDGKIFSGSNFAGAELGHSVIVAGGEVCTCGRHGCWETYASVTALIRQTVCAMEQHHESRMWELVQTAKDVNGRTAFDGMRMGDETATAVVDRYLRYVACGIVNMVNIFQPDVLCIGGAISKEGETLLRPIREYVERERYSRYASKQTEIVCATLGNNAGIIGAAFLDTVTETL